MLHRMRTIALPTLGLALVVCLVGGGCSKPFGPGFEGEITMHTQRVGETGSDMRVKSKGDKFRFDVPSPTGTSTAILDPAANKMTMLLDAQKSYMDLDFSKPSAQPSTNPDTSTAKATGKHETVAGMDCEDWTATDASGKHTDVCLAAGPSFDLGALSGKPSGAGQKQMFPLKSVDYDAKGTELSRMEVTKIEKKKLDDSLFVIPADYKKMELPSMLKH